MTVSKDAKARILQAYFAKSISKGEMEFLLAVGLIVLPIDWIDSTDAEQKKHERKRELIEKVFGKIYPKIEWF